MAALLLILAYPALAHAAIAFDSAPLALLSILDFVLITVLPDLRARRPAAFAVLAVTLLLLPVLLAIGLPRLPLLLPPVLITGFMAWLFGRTLRAGRQPLVERIVKALHGSETLDPEIAAYARRLTGLWTVLLASLSLLNLALAVLAVPDGLLAGFGVTPPLAVPMELWSQVANGWSYVAIGLFFAVEYALRRRRFPQQRYRNFVDFSLRVARLPKGFWRDMVS